MSNILLTFNNQFIEFINYIETIFPDDTDIVTSKNAFILARKSNPKIIIKIWKTCIVLKYKTEIESGDLSFFINKDYSQDIYSTNYDKIMECIDRLRQPIKNMDPTQQHTTMKYIQILTKLSDLYII
jgi:hypothetical protein